MRNETRDLWDAYCARIAELNGVRSVATKFAVDPTVAQAVEQRIQNSSDFLSRINFETVVQQEGEKVGVGISSTVTGRTDTSGGTRRQPIDPNGTDGRRYRCEQTNRDTAIRYARLDAWAHKPEFQQIIRDNILKRKALDRMMIGWNGTSVAATTNRVANPMLQDVNKGWIQHLREERPEQIVSRGDLAAGKIYVHDSGAADFVNLDALVFDLIEGLDEWHRDDTELVTIVGRDLVHDKYFNIVNVAGDKATEQIARDVLISTKKVGGLPAVRVPNFPAGKLAITRLDNLSIYVQAGTQRRAIIDQPDLDRIADFDSSNEAYVVEDNGLMVVAENIEMKAKV